MPPLLTTLALAAPASACSVAAGPGFDPIRDADVVLTGQVVGVRYLDPEPAPGEPYAVNRRYEARVRVRRLFRGDTGPVIRVRGATAGSQCEFGPVHTGERLALLLDGRRSPFRVGITSHTTARDLERRFHGRSHRPGRA